MDKQKALDNLAAEIIKDKICPDLAAQATQLVMGDGNADADIVFIGEAPGKRICRASRLSARRGNSLMRC